MEEEKINNRSQSATLLIFVASIATSIAGVPLKFLWRHPVIFFASTHHLKKWETNNKSRNIRSKKKNYKAKTSENFLTRRNKCVLGKPLNKNSSMKQDMTRNECD